MDQIVRQTDSSVEYQFMRETDQLMGNQQASLMEVTCQDKLGRLFHMVLSNWARLEVDARRVRIEVFVEEQHVPLELEMDEMDAQCIHAVVYDDQHQPVATGRLLPDGHIGRMAVRQVARGSGLGGQVLQQLMNMAQAKGYAEVVLSAQVHAIGFYERYGFVAEGDEYMDAGIPHRLMRHVFAK